jgi:hypothetical protein
MNKGHDGQDKKISLERNDIHGGGYLVWCFYVAINS